MRSEKLEERRALVALGALGDGRAFAIFDHIWRAPEGVSRDYVASQLGSTPAQLADNIRSLIDADLICQDEREMLFPKRAVLGMLFQFLMEDCCDGSSETYSVMVDTLAELMRR